MKRFLKQKRNLICLCWPVGFLCYILARCNSDIAEYVFARGIYRVYGFIMSFLTGFLPFSVAEWLLILFVLALVLYPFFCIIRIVRSKEKLYTVLDSLRLLIMALGIVFLWYMIGAGTNYYRYEFAEFSGLEVKKSSVDELYGLCEELLEKTNEARAALGISDEEIFVSSMTNRERASACRDAMEKLSEQYDVLKGFYPYAKPVLFSRAMSEFNITGVYFPWTVESNVNVDVPDYSKASTTCHELSHLRGFMREDEANYIGYLACVNSDSAELKYSGYMLALIVSMNKLYDADKDKYGTLRGKYNAGVSLDLIYNSKYWHQFEDTVLSEAGEAMNDTYLKANNVTDGTRSYGRMVDLLLAERRKKVAGQNS